MPDHGGMTPARLWIPVLAGVLTVALGIAAVIGLEWLTADRRPTVVTASQADAIADVFAENQAFAAELRRARGQYVEAAAAWEADAAWIRQWREQDAAPQPAAPNPGGQVFPGDDPQGRAFLDSIGATEVTVIFDAGPENCGYAGQEDRPRFLVVGGCYQTGYPD